MEYTDNFAVSQILRDDAPLNFCDWSLNPTPAVDDVVIDSFEKIEESVVDELIGERQKITKAKKLLLSLPLEKAMRLHSAEKIPKLRQKVVELKAELAKLNELLCNASSMPPDVLKKTFTAREKILKSISYYENKRIPSCEKLSLRVCKCNNFFDYRLFHSLSLEKQVKKLERARTCQTRLCPACNARRAYALCLKTMAQVVSMAKNGFAECGVKGKKKKVFIKNLQTSFLTLTYPNPKLADVKETFTLMRQGLAKLFSDQNKYKKGATRNDWIRKNILGALCCMEWFGDKTKNGEAHLHFHILLVHDGVLANNNRNYVESIFRREWIKATGFKKKWLSVNWQPAKSYEQAVQDAMERGVLFDEKFKNVKDNNKKALLGMVLEVSKYSVTQATLKKMSAKNIAELYEQTEFCRQVETFGVFRGFEWQGETIDSLIESVLTDYVDVKNGDWARKSVVNFYWNHFEKRYRAELRDDLDGILLAPLPELEEPKPPDKLLPEESFDVPLG